jgi:hypothetical protein
MERGRRGLVVVRLSLALSGLGLLAGGLAGYDWRIAAIACGGLLLGVAIVDAAVRGKKQ